MLLEADQKEEGKRGTKQIVEPDSDFWLFEHNTVTTHPEVGDRKLWMAQNSSQLSSVCRATYTKQAATSKKTFAAFLFAKWTVFSPASGGCWVGKEYIMTLILWQNKGLHQGQCHTLFQMGLHPTHNSSCYRTVQLLLWRTAPITSLHPLSQRNTKESQQTRNFSGVTIKKNKEIKKLNTMSFLTLL